MLWKDADVIDVVFIKILCYKKIGPIFPLLRNFRLSYNSYVFGSAYVSLWQAQTHTGEGELSRSPESNFYSSVLKISLVMV